MTHYRRVGYMETKGRNKSILYVVYRSVQRLVLFLKSMECYESVESVLQKLFPKARFYFRALEKNTAHQPN